MFKSKFILGTRYRNLWFATLTPYFINGFDVASYYFNNLLFKQLKRRWYICLLIVLHQLVGKTGGTLSQMIATRSDELGQRTQMQESSTWLLCDMPERKLIGSCLSEQRKTTLGLNFTVMQTQRFVYYLTSFHVSKCLYCVFRLKVNPGVSLAV